MVTDRKEFMWKIHFILFYYFVMLLVNIKKKKINFKLTVQTKAFQVFLFVNAENIFTLV